MSRQLLDVVAVHDVEDLIPDPLAIAPRPNTGQQQPDEWPAFGFAPPKSGKFLRQAILGMTELARLCVVIALPGQLPQRRIPKPDKKQRQRVRFALGPVQQIMA